MIDPKNALEVTSFNKPEPAPTSCAQSHPAWPMVIEDMHAMLGLPASTTIEHIGRPFENATNDMSQRFLRLAALMRERNDIGAKKYGTPLLTFNGRRPLIDTLQELLDACAYMRQEIEERIKGRSVTGGAGFAIESTYLDLIKLTCTVFGYCEIQYGVSAAKPTPKEEG